jgi:hypothetical protein
MSAFGACLVVSGNSSDERIVSMVTWDVNEALETVSIEMPSRNRWNISLPEWLLSDDGLCCCSKTVILLLVFGFHQQPSRYFVGFRNKYKSISLIH